MSKGLGRAYSKPFVLLVHSEVRHKLTSTYGIYSRGGTFSPIISSCPRSSWLTSKVSQFLTIILVKEVENYRKQKVTNQLSHSRTSSHRSVPGVVPFQGWVCAGSLFFVFLTREEGVNPPRRILIRVHRSSKRFLFRSCWRITNTSSKSISLARLKEYRDERGRDSYSALHCQLSQTSG